MKTAVVLGGTFPHRDLLAKLRDRGYHTVLVDYYENPIAKDFADSHYKVSTLDKDMVLEVAREERADLVISSCVDQANVTACYVAEKLGLPHPYSYETAVAVTDKNLMKHIMFQNGIPTSSYYTIESVNEFVPDKLKYPIIIKPSDSNSSKGVRRIDAFDNQSLSFVSQALSISRNGCAIVEEFKVGKEIGVDCIIKDHHATVVMTRERRKIHYNNSDAIQQIYGSFWPACISQKQLLSLQEIAEQIALAFDLNNTPLMMQTIVCEDDISVIEFGARIGGGENYRIIKELTGYDFIDQSIDSFLNKSISSSFHAPKIKLADNYIYMTPGLFGRIEIDERVRDELLYYNVYRKPGAEIGKDISSNNRVGVFVVASEDEGSLLKKIYRVVDNMEVFDYFNHPVMRKDIY